MNSATPAITDPLVIAGRSFRSRLLLGTGKFSSNDVLAAAVAASGAEIVTVALRRATAGRNRASGPAGVVGTARSDGAARTAGTDGADGAVASSGDPIAALDLDSTLLLINTSGAVDADEAVRLCRLARSSGLPPWVKLEVTPDPRSLWPDPIETVAAARILCDEGFVVLPYCPADPIVCRRLADVGCATVMPLGAAIGTNQGLTTRAALEIIIEQATVPVVVDAGIGAPSHAAQAMEMGADAVLVNTAIATAGQPVEMAAAFAAAVVGGRRGFLAGLAPRSTSARASSPLTGFLERE